MRHAIPLLTLALLGACTVGPDYKGPPAIAREAVARGTFVRAQDAALTPAPGLARWWEPLGDATLTALVEDALAHSPTIEAAAANLRAAQAQYRQQRAARLPSVSASGVYLNARLPGTGIGDGGGGGGEDGDTALDFYNLGGTASWEPDLFGGGRRAREQGHAAAEQRFAQLADAQVTLSAQVAQAYVGLRDAQARTALNAQSSMLQRRQLALVEQRYTAGTASRLQVERLRTQLNETDAQTIPLAAQIDEYKGQLAILAGRAPGALDATLAPARPVPLPPAQVPIGDPAALIAHRPDIRAAERELAAGSARIGVATARMFPSLKLMGIVGLGGTGILDVLDPSKLATLAAPMLSWSFLDFGRNRAAVAQAEAQRDAAAAQYRQAVLEALQDAETSLSRFGNTRAQLAQLLLADQSATRAARLNAQRVEAGTSTLVDQLDVERQRVSAAIAVEQGRAQLTGNYIAVQKSLGLGWIDPPGSARP
ncbi:RND transporter [Sphingomonas sp. Leaf231]|uniref:efflux transporter outer membrane subunit n=1 Tax=Sphingomonas sp. Leaf231 TaxID=1736301 RepID=UPI0006F25706|nr:efflux transporter outer membrane subunit [Sphingomonas sp. Leaf231]KQN92819.1 RND transporter [Sphingomonas sp. Leaf231]